MASTCSLFLRRVRPYAAALGLAAALGSSAPREASACGCFVPPDFTVPIVQAGERILFARQGADVVAHIQIQYAGRPADFGWLLPLPTVPKNRKGQDGIDLSTDELFAQLQSTTQPRYRLNVVNECRGRATSGFGCAAASDTALNAPGAGGGGIADMGAPSPLVAQDTIGPYEFAILKADSKDDMLDWLSKRAGSRFENRPGRPFAVPTGTDAAVVPYIRPGSFFLALQLQAGKSTGDLQPVQVRYKADVPMIPIILTAVAATPNMGVLVWVLGSGRAVPRNYQHVVINDALLDWQGGVQNYPQIVTRAVAEASGKHAFVTEYAGPSRVMQGILDAPGRFNVLVDLETLRNPNPADRAEWAVSAVELLLGQGAQVFRPFGNFVSILQGFLPVPAALGSLAPLDYLQRLRFYLLQDRPGNKDRYKDIEAQLQKFDPVELAAVLRDRIATPSQEAGQLFRDEPYLTRMFTTLSPADMNLDPAFDINGALADVPLEHVGTLHNYCDYSEVVTESGYRIPAGGAPAGLPASRRIEVLRQSGQPEVVQDNAQAIGMVVGAGGGGGGCMTSAARRRTPADAALALLCCGAIALRLRRRWS